MRARLIIAATVLFANSLVAQAGADHYKRGMDALRANDGDAAVAAFEKAVAADDRNASYHLGLARGLGLVAQKANTLRQPFLARRCRSEFERVVQLEPTNVDAREGLIQFYTLAPSIMGGSMAKAREQADAILGFNKMRGHIALANMALRAKDVATYEREVRSALAAGPDSSAAISAAGAFYANTSRYDEGFAMLDRVLTTRRDQPLARLWYGRLAAMSGQRLDKGEAALRALLTDPTLGEDGMPSAANVHFRLGELLIKKGDKAGARTALEAALKLNPKLDAARKALQSL